jgi:nucleoside 2-deoxyribosyltransferase
LGVNIVNPWEERASQGTRSLKGVIDGKNLNDVIAIGMNNIEGLKRSDVVLAVLDGPDVDSGTAGEIGFAYGLGKLILGYRGDARVVTDAPSTKINLQIETFIRASGGSVYDTIEEAIAEINRVNASRNASRYKEEALTGS